MLVSDVKGTFDFGNESRVTRIVYHLLKRIDKTQRLPLLKTAMSHGGGIGVQRYLLATLQDEQKIQEEGGAEALIDSDAFEELKAVWIGQLKAQSDDQLLAHDQLARLLSAWYQWGDQSEVHSWCERLTVTDESLLIFIPKFCLHNSSQTMGDWAVRIKPRLNPTWLERFIDTSTCNSRLIAMLNAGQVSDSALESVRQFLKEFEMIRNGKNPDGVGAFDED